MWLRTFIIQETSSDKKRTKKGRNKKAENLHGNGVPVSNVKLFTKKNENK